MPNAHVAAAATGLPEVDCAALLFPKATLASLSMTELAQLIHSVEAHVGGSAMLAGPGRITPAGEMVQELSNMLVSVLSDITSVAQAHRPTSRAEANWRGWLLLSHAALFSDALSDIAVTAAAVAKVERDLGAFH